MAKKKKSDRAFSAFLALFFLIIIDLVLGMRIVFPNYVTSVLIAISAVSMAFFSRNNYSKASLIGVIFIVLQSISRIFMPLHHYCKVLFILFFLSIVILLFTFSKKSPVENDDKRRKPPKHVSENNAAVLSILLSPMFSVFDMLKVYFMCDW
jgi:hypothetical protein